MGWRLIKESLCSKNLEQRFFFAQSKMNNNQSEMSNSALGLDKLKTGFLNSARNGETPHETGKLPTKRN